MRLFARFKYRVVNYAKVYYACGHCDGSGNVKGQEEKGAYAISKSLKQLTGLEKHDPKQKVEEVRFEYDAMISLILYLSSV